MKTTAVLWRCERWWPLAAACYAVGVSTACFYGSAKLKCDRGSTYAADGSSWDNCTLFVVCISDCLLQINSHSIR
jgi:hypothetical protein